MPVSSGFELISLLSRVDPIKHIEILDYNQLSDQISKYIDGNGWVVAYLDYKVLVGRFENRLFSFFRGEIFEPKFMQKIRVFNDERELFIWRQGHDYKARLRVDGEGEKEECVEARQIIWGTEILCKEDGWTVITEKRGTEIALPLPDLEVGEENNRRAVLVTRNYIDYKNGCLAGYVDCRMVRLEEGFNG